MSLARSIPTVQIGLTHRSTRSSPKSLRQTNPTVPTHLTNRSIQTRQKTPTIQRTLMCLTTQSTPIDRLGPTVQTSR